MHHPQMEFKIGVIYTRRHLNAHKCTRVNLCVFPGIIRAWNKVKRRCVDYACISVEGEVVFSAGRNKDV